MKIRNNSLAFCTMLLLGTAAFQGGCATTGMDRSVKTSNSIQDVDGEIRKMIIQIDATHASLDSVFIADQTDLRKKFDSYSDNVRKLDSQGTLMIKRMDELKANRKEYFSEWEKQGDAYTNPRIRELSEDRRKNLSNIYDQIPAATSDIKISYRDYLTDLKEIQKYLSNDLTPKGVETIAPVAKKTVLHLDALKTSLRPVITALDEIKFELYKQK